MLVRVGGAGVNGADILQRAGGYPAPSGSPPDIPGLELAGEVVARGPGAERFEEGELTISAQSQDVGETRETMPVGFSGEPIEIGFNADFLREGLESVPADEITLNLINPLRPGLITAEGDAFWYLIMPIRLAG